MPHGIYDTPAWQRTRAHVLARDGDRCTVARLIGGDCHPRLHCHHVVPVGEGGAPFDPSNVLTACASHHPMIEALRRRLLALRTPPEPKCPHRHPYPQGRRECEQRRARVRQTRYN